MPLAAPERQQHTHPEPAPPFPRPVARHSPIPRRQPSVRTGPFGSPASERLARPTADFPRTSRHPSAPRPAKARWRIATETHNRYAEVILAAPCPNASTICPISKKIRRVRARPNRRVPPAATQVPCRTHLPERASMTIDAQATSTMTKTRSIRGPNPQGRGVRGPSRDAAQRWQRWNRRVNESTKQPSDGRPLGLNSVSKTGQADQRIHGPTSRLFTLACRGVAKAKPGPSTTDGRRWCDWTANL